ncbi:type VI secretion system tip protein TssI/VgrG [Sorangium sp. So ce119]|uniref:type VI secretion system Vgr family protein n=1 Tax=Sorangium sp. So ce119 TaxID=3133279 RepID=UPI003F6161BD
MPLATLQIGGKALGVSDVSGRAALSELFRFDVRAFTRDEPPALAELVGQPFELTLSDPFDRAMTIRGLVMEAERTAGALGGGTFALGLEPEAAQLTVGRDSRVFQHMTVVDIVKKVLDKAGIAAENVRFAVTADYAKRVYCAQYRESDWHFIERLLAEEGIYYWFEHDSDATRLVFSDDSTLAPDIEGDPIVPFHDDTELQSVSDSVLRVHRRRAVATDAVRLRDYNFNKPRLTLDAKAGSGAREVYDFPGRFGAPKGGERRARVRIEALRARVSVTSGETWTTRMRAGLVFELAGHPIDSLNGRYLLDAVAYRARGLGEGPDDAPEGERAPGIQMRWSGIPVATAFRAPVGRVTRSPGGPQPGVVVGASGKEIHPDDTGRVRVQHYWDREGKLDDKASTWMRVGQFALGGSMILPRLGWEVVVEHHEDDVDDPFVLLHFYDGQFPAPYALPANKTRTAWQTATTPGGGSTNEIRFEDKKGSEEMFINASKDMNVAVGDNRTEKVGVDLEETIGSNLDVTIGTNAKVGITADQSVSIGGSESLTVSSNRSVDVGGDETIAIGGSRTVSVKGASLEATGGRTLTVGGSMMAASALGVSRMVLGSMSVTVGGSWITAAAAGLANITAGAGAETVGGAKIQAAPGPCNTSVKGALAETVGGAYVVAAGGNAAESAAGSLRVTVGGALLGNAPKILIEAKSEISIRVGAASITVKPGSVEVKAPTLASPGAKIKKKASTIRHN